MSIVSNFSNVNFTRADLRSTSFRNSDLQYANFTNADLRNTILLGANLRGAIVTGARLDGCKYDTCWKIVDGKFVHVDDIPPAKDQYDFARKFDIASRLIDALDVVPANHRRDILAVVCKKFGFKPDDKISE